MNKIESAPFMSTVLRTTAKEIVGGTPINNTAGQRGRNWANVKTANINEQSRVAQMYAGGNINVTAPNFYSPFLTPSSFQIPNTRKEVYLWANWWVTNEPKVAAGINFYKNFPFNGWKLECQSSAVKEYYEKLIRKLNFTKLLPDISKSYHQYGDVFVFLSLDCQKCHGSNVTEDGQPCNHEGATWKSATILNPDSILISPGFMDSQPTYAYMPSEKEIKVLTTREPKELYDAIPNEVKHLIMKKDPIKLNPQSIHHFKHAGDPWSDYGMSLIRPLFPTLAYKDKLRQAQWLVAERHIVPIKLIKVGSEQRPASQQDIDNVQEQIAAIANDPNLTLVTHHAFDIDYVGASGKVLQLTNEHELIDQEILDGLMLNKSLLNGEGPNYGNAQVGLIAMNERLETWRREVAQWIEEKIFKPVAEWNGFTTTGESGDEELIYPTIKFDDLQLRDETGKLQMLVTAQSNGVISAQTLVESMGYNWDQEVERLRFEHGNSFVGSPEIANTDIDLGFSMPSIGGGAMMGAPAAPGMTGTPGLESVPGAIAPPGALAPPVASSLGDQVRLAANIINSIFHNRTTIYALNGFERKANKTVGVALNTKTAVTGRGLYEAYPDDIQPDASEWQYLQLGWPMNYQATKEITAAKKQQPEMQPQFFTSIEKQLYNIVLSLNIPLPFYAQYVAGPSMEFQLDGAFPGIKLGLEADGEVWHSGADKQLKDQQRDIKLAQQGWTILRFTDKEVTDQPKEVAHVILSAVKQLSNSSQSGSL